MQFKFTPRFNRSVDRMRLASLRKKVLEVVHNVQEAATIRDVPNLKKLKGHPSAYRIRIGDHRIGILLEGDLVIFTTVDHRKKIYNRFP